MHTSKTFAIGIPTINRYDLLAPFLKNYMANFPNTLIYVLDNGLQEIEVQGKNFHLITSSEPKGVAASWNALCNFIFKEHNYALILNDDVFFDKTQHQVHEFLAIHHQPDFYISQKGYCSFIMPKVTFNRVGKFDESFKGAYFEDNDYNRRMYLDRSLVLKHKFLNPGIYNESSSISKDKSLNANYDRNLVHYEEKWGGCVGAEKYLKPFNK